jgi:hypothetical protein
MKTLLPGRYGFSGARWRAQMFMGRRDNSPAMTSRGEKVIASLRENDNPWDNIPKSAEQEHRIGKQSHGACGKFASMNSGE